MTEPKTLLQLSRADLSPSKIGEAVLVLIDMQNEYVAGPIAVSGVESAVNRAAVLLGAAREAGSLVIHVVHAREGRQPVRPQRQARGVHRRACAKGGRECG